MSGRRARLRVRRQVPHELERRPVQLQQPVGRHDPRLVAEGAVDVQPLVRHRDHVHLERLALLADREPPPPPATSCGSRPARSRRPPSSTPREQLFDDLDDPAARPRRVPPATTTPASRPPPATRTAAATGREYPAWCAAAPFRRVPTWTSPSATRNTCSVVAGASPPGGPRLSSNLPVSIRISTSGRRGRAFSVSVDGSSDRSTNTRRAPRGPCPLCTAPGSGSKVPPPVPLPFGQGRTRPDVRGGAAAAAGAVGDRGRARRAHRPPAASVPPRDLTQEGVADLAQHRLPGLHQHRPGGGRGAGRAGGGHLADAADDFRAGSCGRGRRAQTFIATPATCT